MHIQNPEILCYEDYYQSVDGSYSTLLSFTGDISALDVLTN